MVRFEGIGVCRSERDGELVGRAGQVVSQGLGREIKSTIILGQRRTCKK